MTLKDSGGADPGFAERLKEVVEDHGNKTRLAKAIGRTEGALRNWTNKRSQPVVDDILRICRLTGTRVEWLMIGRGPRREAQITQVRESAVPYQAPQLLDESLLRAITEAVEREDRALSSSGKLTAEKKAGLIAHCYRFMGSMAAFDPKAVAQLVRLAS